MRLNQQEKEFFTKLIKLYWEENNGNHEDNCDDLKISQSLSQKISESEVIQDSNTRTIGTIPYDSLSDDFKGIINTINQNIDGKR